MKKIFFLTLLFSAILSYSQLANNSFNLNNNYGDLYMRRYVDNDLKFKRALSSGGNQLIINFAGDYSNGTRVMGKFLKVDNWIKIDAASTIDNRSAGVIYSGGANDDFLYDGKYLNHYGMGFYGYSRSEVPGGSNAYLSGYFGIDFFTGGKNRIRVNRHGNIGIGSRNPDSKLTVKGKIHCEEVKVDLQVPADYVFEKYYTGTSTLKEDYQMLSLEEVEAFTKKNNHLPEIPSAKEIQKEGLHLKKMTNLLLQKIEELTLYTIEQEKRIKVLEELLNSKKQ